MPVKNISVREARASQAAGSTYVDVRSVPEFASGHPSGAVNVPLLHSDARTGRMSVNEDFIAIMQASFPPETPLLLGCQVGGRSAQAAHLLASAGYQNVANVLGGFAGMPGPVPAEGWVQAGLPVEEEASAGQSFESLLANARRGK